METGERSSIRKKLRLAVIAATSLALLGTCASFLVYQSRTFQASAEADLETIATIIGYNSESALLFLDDIAAEETLSSLSADEHVASACIYDLSNQQFARYSKKAATGGGCPKLKPPGCEMGRLYLSCFYPIYSKGAGHKSSIGSIYIQADNNELKAIRRNYLLIASVVLLFAVIAVSIVFEQFIRAGITKPLERLVDGAQAVAAGNLSTKVHVETSDEIGTLAHAFNAMASGLSGLVSQVRKTVGSISNVTASLSKASNQMSEEVRRQEASVEEAADSVARFGTSIGEVNKNAENLSASAMETSSSMLEMNASINSIADHMDGLAGSIETASSSVMEMSASITQIGQNVDTLEGATLTTESALQTLNGSVTEVGNNAQRSQDLSQQTSERAQTGMQSVTDMIGAMDSIQGSFGRLEGTINALDERSESIGKVIRVIDEVVEQTKLLSLNASIIASQAGEHGKSFAVVADEVKSLSDRTAQSTREITDLVKIVQGDMGQAVQMMSEGSEHVSRGVSLSKEAGEALESIMECSHLSSQMVNEIVGATTAQNSDLGDLGRSVETVKGIVQQVRGATREQSNVSSEILRLVEGIRSLGLEVKRSTQEQGKEATQIAEAMESVMSMINEIVASTQGQTKDNSKLQAALEVFSEMTVESGRIAQEMKGMVDMLSERSHEVDQEIDNFQVSEDEH